MTTRAPRKRFGVFTGIGFLGKGLGMWLTSPGLMLLGALPALIVGIVYAGGIVLFLMNIDPITAFATPFASGWDETGRAIARVVAGLAIAAAAVLVVIFTFTAVTLAVGDPFYARIWRAVEEKAGGVPEPIEEKFATSLLRGLGNGLRLFLFTALVGVLLFAAGFIPFVGQTVVPALGVLMGGWFLSLSLTGFAFDGRGIRLRGRRKVLGRQRSTTLGFGAATYLLFLLPLGAVVVMPAAVAGATLMARAALED